MAITSEKLLPPSKSAAFSSVAVNRPSTELHRRYGGRLAMQKSLQEKMVSGGPTNVVLTKKSAKNIGIIKTKVIEIESILKGTLASEKKALDEKKRQESGKRREKQEEKLETRPSAEKGIVKMPSVPRLGIFDWIKNFIGNIILGYFAVRLIDHLPKIIPILKFIGKATDFVIDIGGKLLNGLATFIDWGYKAYDSTRGFLKSLGGEDFVKGFDKFIGALDTAVFLTTFLAADLLAESLSGDGGGGGLVEDQVKRRVAQQGAQQVTRQVGSQAASQVGRTAGMGAGTVAAVVAGAGLLASALGEGAFQVRKVAIKPIQNLEKAYNEDKNPLTKIGRGIALTMVRPFYGLFSTVGFLLDVVGAPFRYAIELLRYPFLSEEDKVKQATNLAKFDARIREDLRKALNMLTFGLAFKEKGSFGNIYGNKGAQKEMMGKMAGGGITRGGKTLGSIKRTVTKQKYKRVITRKPSKTQFKTDSKDPQVKVGEELDKTKYFGPILAVTNKLQLKEEPTQKDYENVGLGLNLLIAKGIEDKQLKGGLVAAFAEGGMVDSDFLEAAEKGADISSWISTTFKNEFETNAQKTLRLIKEKKGMVVDSKEGKSDETPNLSVEDGGFTVTGGNADFWALVAIASLENSNPQGQADVAQVLYNRVASNLNFGQKNNTIKGHVIAPGQFQPTREGDPRLWAAISDKQSAIAAVASHPRGRTNAARMVESAASAIQNKQLQESAAQFVGGRTDFSATGQYTPHPGAIGIVQRHGHDIGWFVGPAAIAYGQKNPGPARAPQLGDIVVMGGDGRGGKFGGGKFIQGNSGASAGVHFHIGPGSQVKGTILQRQYFADARATAKQAIDYFLNKGSTVYDGRRGRYYKSGNEVAAAQRAHTGSGSAGGIDMQVDFEKPVPFPLKTTGMAYRRNGFGVSADIVGSNSFVAHGRYDENGKVAPQERMKLYAKGGLVRGFTKAMLGERGIEFVLDTDTTTALEQNFPGFLDALNKANYDGAISVLRNYAEYEQPYSQPEIQYIEVPVPMPIETETPSPGMIAMFGGGDSDPFETLYQGT